MGYRAFGEKIGFEEAIESVEFTLHALEAHEAAALNKLGKPLQKVIDDADALRLRRRDARRASVRASARLRVADGREEDEIRELDKDVLAEVRQDRSAPLYQAIFQGTMSALLALSVDPQNSEVMRIQSVLESSVAPAELKRSWRARLTRIVETVTAALANRRTAQLGAAEVELDIQRWKERADRARRAVDGALTTHAAENGLPRDFNDRFYPAAPSSSRKRTESEDPAPAPTA